VDICSFPFFSVRGSPFASSDGVPAWHVPAERSLTDVAVFRFFSIIQVIADRASVARHARRGDARQRGNAEWASFGDSARSGLRRPRREFSGVSSQSVDGTRSPGVPASRGAAECVDAANGPCAARGSGGARACGIGAASPEAVGSSPQSPARDAPCHRYRETVCVVEVEPTCYQRSHRVMDQQPDFAY
jgi:hypothetical protein